MSVDLHGRTPGLPGVGPRSLTALVLSAAVGLLGFGWPFLADPASTSAGHTADAPWLLAAACGLVLACVLAAVVDGQVDTKALAMLGVLSAAGAAMRPLGAGAGGVEPMFVVLVMGGRVLGPVMGFALGNTAMLASAVLTGGIGPWLPFQMATAGWVALGAGIVPRRWRGWCEVAALAGYAALAGLCYGAVMNLWFWPFGRGLPPSLAYDAAAPAGTNVRHYLAFYLATSLGWDLVRAVVNATLVLLAGRRLAQALRRAVRQAAFDVPIAFSPPEPELEPEPDMPRRAVRRPAALLPEPPT